nr:hypothetical protein B0A51_05220 [Rachicladosporium sp. CCFEE 5018]
MKGFRAAVVAAVINGASAQLGGYNGVTTTTTTTPVAVYSTPASSTSLATSTPSSSAAPISPITSSSTQSYVTVTYDDCPSSSVPTLITVTNGVTVTYCPECEMKPTSSPVIPHTTVYTTVYSSLCSTGLVPATYTITESCTAATPSWATHSTAIPPGFTTTVKTCTVCESTPIPVTITEPCDCEATSGVPMTQTAASTTASMPSATGSIISQISDGQVQAPAGTPTGSSPPYPTTAGSNCPGPQCRAVASASPGVTYGNTSGITPYTGGASGVSAGLMSSLVFALLTGVFAFAL